MGESWSSSAHPCLTLSILFRLSSSRVPPKNKGTRPTPNGTGHHTLNYKMADTSLNEGVKDEIRKHDRTSLKPTNAGEKSTVSSQQIMLATVAKGGAKERLKPAETTEKTWKPTAEDIAQDKSEGWSQEKNHVGENSSPSPLSLMYFFYEITVCIHAFSYSCK